MKRELVGSLFMAGNQAKTKYLRTVSTTSQVPFMPGSMTNTSPARRWIGCSPSGVMTQ